MSLRINKGNLGELSPYARMQIEKHLDLPDNVETLPVRAPAPRKSVNRPEEDAGKLLVEWIDLLRMRDGLRPGLFFMHTPNGLARNATEGGIFKAQGLRKGWPDYSLDLPLGPYHGLRLELKAIEGAEPTPDQLEILERLEAVGFKCCVAWGFDDASQQIEQYLDLAN